MSDRDKKIIELTHKGFSALKIKQRLGLTITPRSIQRVQERELGKHRPANNSRTNQLPIHLRPYVYECLRRRGLDPYVCGNCGEVQLERCEVHHTKYEGATIYDLMYVCLSCNRSRANCGLA